MKSNSDKKWAFVRGYDDKRWTFEGVEFDPYEHRDDGDCEFKAASLSESQLDKAFMEDGIPEPGYAYVILKSGKVRQGRC